MPATEVRPQTGAEAYSQRLIELATALPEPHLVQTHFFLLASLETLEARDFLIAQSFAPNAEVRGHAGAALATIKADAVVIPLARKVTPEVAAELISDTTRLSMLPVQKRVQFLAEVIPAGLAKYYQAERGNETPGQHGTRILTHLMVQRSMIAATELPEGREALYGPAAQVLLANLLERTENERLERFLVDGGDAAVPAVLRITRGDSMKSTAVRMLMDINTELSWAELKSRLASLSDHDVDINRLSQGQDPAFRRKALELLTPAPERSFRFVSAASHDITPALTTLTSNTPQDQRSELIPMLALQATSHNEKTAQAAITSLLELDTSEARDTAYEVISRTGAGLETFLGLASSSGDIRTKLLRLLETSSYGSRIAQMIETGLAKLDPQLLTTTVNETLTSVFENKQRVPSKVADLAAQLKLADVLPTLYELLEGDKFHTTAEAIAKYGTPETVQHLLERLAKADQDQVRANVASGLRYVPFDVLDEVVDPEQTERMQRLTGGALQTYRQQVVSGLVVSAFKGPSSGERKDALSTLGEIGDLEVAKLLWEKLADEDYEVRHCAAYAIRRITEREQKKTTS